jgi:hypothetical protein
MKSAILIISLFPLLFIVTGCQKAKQQTNSKADTVRPNVKSITEVRYNFAFGEVEKEGKKASYTTFGYDSAGKLSEKLKYLADGSLDQKTTYQYDPKGNLVTEREFEHYKDFKDPTFGTYEYNDSGKVTEYTEDWKTTSLHYSYTYDERGHLSEGVVYESKGKLSRREKYKYDEKGNEIEELILESNSDGKWLSKYSEDNKIIEKDWYEADGSLNSIYTFTYDDSRRLIESVGRESPEGRIYSKETYKYDGSGNLLERGEFSYSGIGEPTRLDKFLYEYEK